MRDNALAVEAQKFVLLQFCLWLLKRSRVWSVYGVTDV